MNIAIIPARGGSKRIPKKNIKIFHGKPIISYSIEAAIESNCFDKIIVSTDDEKIAKIAKKNGAEVPFIRPGNISNDYANTIDVIKHSIEWFENQGCDLTFACCIYPTAPFIQPSDILKGFKFIKNSEVEYVFTATDFQFPIQRAFYLNDELQPTMIQPNHINTRSQDLEPGYHDAGQFYWGTIKAFKNGLPIFKKHSKVILLPQSRVQDIDTHEDWLIAELKYKALNNL